MSERLLGLKLDPLDPLFFRDGRPFDASTHVATGLPNPPTLAGALRTVLLARQGFDFAQFARRRRGKLQSADQHQFAVDLRECFADGLQNCGVAERHLQTRFRGPWLALELGDKVIPLLPVPACLVRGETGVWNRSAPLQERLPGWKAPRWAPQLRPLWLTEADDAEFPGGFLTLTGITSFLNGDLPADDEWFEADDLYGFDSRTGIGLNADSRTCAESQLYGIRFLALKRSLDRRPRFVRSANDDPYTGATVMLYAEAVFPLGHDSNVDTYLKGPIPFGGEGKYVEVSVIRTPAVWPGTGLSTESGTKRPLWLLASHGVFPAMGERPAWMPDAIEPGNLCGAASRGGIAISGWDGPANGPKPTRFAVPAGSVYFATSPDSLPGGSLCNDANDVAEGWGFALKGVW